MAKENKTTETNASVIDFIESFVQSKQKIADSFELIEIMKECSGMEPKMWGPTMIGFGSYHYKYASGHEGDAFIIGFSPRKAAISLYLGSPSEAAHNAIQTLGKFKQSKACIYVSKLSDLNRESLVILCNESIRYIQENKQCACKE
jgi:hypothetical protein